MTPGLRLYTPNLVKVAQNVGMQHSSQLGNASKVATLLSKNRGLANAILDHLLTLIRDPYFLNFYL